MNAMKNTVYEILEGTSPFRRVSKTFSLLIMGLIILNCVAITLETIDRIYIGYQNLFNWLEIVSIGIFSAEYFLRVWSCTSSSDYKHPIFGRLHFIASPMAIVDLLAILPFYLSLFATDLRFLRALRLLRIFRILKLVRYSKALKTFGVIVVSKKEELIITGVLSVIVIFISSSFMYYFEHEAQPDEFSSIPDTMWWAVITLTTVGYGDTFPITNMGKIFGGAIAVVGIGMFALPAGILGSAFVLEDVFHGSRRVVMRNHFIICGMGKIGVQVMEHLLRLGKEVVVVEQSESNIYLSTARNHNVPVVIGDIRMAETLEDAGVREAGCLIALSDKDMANLEAALNAQAVKDNIHIVLRVFDHALAGKIQTGFGIQNAFSPSTLAAPAFAMAAVDPSVIGSFYVGDNLMLNMELTVAPGASLDGMTTTELERDNSLSILLHTCHETGKQQLHISEEITLKAGDKLVISTEPEVSQHIHELNTPA